MVMKTFCEQKESLKKENLINKNLSKEVDRKLKF